MDIFDSVDDLPLNKQLKFPTMTIVVRSVFEEDDKYYPQDEYQMNICVSYKCQNTIELIFQKELTLIKQVHQKSVIFGIIAYTKKYLRSDWLRGVQYCPYLYSVFISCTLLNKKKNTTFEFRAEKQKCIH